MTKRKYTHTKEYLTKKRFNDMIDSAYQHMGELSVEWVKANELYLGGTTYAKVRWDKWYYLKRKIKRLFRINGRI